MKWTRWTEEELKLLGNVPDRVIAEQLGCSIATVSRKRKQLNIPRYTGQRATYKPRSEWKPEHLALLGKATDGVVAQIVGCNIVTIWKKRKSLGIPPTTIYSHTLSEEEFNYRKKLCLKYPDSKVAQILGVHIATIKSFRMKHNIRYTPKTKKET